MGSLESKPSCASPQCDTNFGRVCPKVWRSGGRGPWSTDPSRTCPCSPPAPQRALARLCLGALLSPPARLVRYNAPAPCSTSPATSSEVPQRRQVLPWAETLQTASLPPFPCCSTEASLRLRSKKALRGSFWHELPLEIQRCRVAKGWPWSWACQRAAGSPHPPWALVRSLQRKGTGWGSCEEAALPPHLPPLPQTLPPGNPESPPTEWHEGNECFSISPINYMDCLPQLKEGGGLPSDLGLGLVSVSAFASKSWGFVNGVVGEGD